MSGIWRCTVCHKVKDLSGSHLRGKTSVRSDCWPCAKKQTFLLDGGNSAVEASAENKANPSATLSGNPFTQSSPASGSSRNVFTVTNTSHGATASPSSSPFNDVVKGAAKNDSGNPFFVSGPGVGASSTSGTSSGNRSPIIIKSAVSEAGRGTSPSFTFSAAPPVHTQATSDSAARGSGNPFLLHSGAAAAPGSAGPWALPSSTTAAKSGANPPHQVAQNPFAGSSSSTARPKSELSPFSTAATTSISASTAPEEEDVWRCSVCHKIKALAGRHLNGKTSVRSDCWPCAKKQTFLRGGSSNPAPPQNAGPGVSGASALTTQQTMTTTTTSSSAGASVWKDPVIPQLTACTGTSPAAAAAISQSIGTASSKAFFLQSSDNTGDEHGASTVKVSALSSSPPFEALLLLQYRQQLVNGIRLRTSWGMGANSDNALYVIAPQPTLTTTVQTVNAKLGQYASLFLAIEHKLSSSPFRRLQRIFCPTEFSYAAACMYSTCMSDTATAPLISVYGPQVDHTATLSEYGAIIQSSVTVGHDRVVSADARVEAARSIYQNCGWLVSPAHATAEAIRLQEGLCSGESGAQQRGADVVIIPQGMPLQELPQAVALAHRASL